jgi:hypothetical protein
MANVNKVKRPDMFITLNDKDYKLKYTLSSFAMMEDRYGNVDAAMDAMNKGSFKAIIFMLYIGLVSSDKSVTEEFVGDTIEIQDMTEIAEKMNAVMNVDLPQKDDQATIAGTSPNAQIPEVNQ